MRWACRRPALPCRPRNPDGPRRRHPPRGPLRVHPGNPRYFTDGSGRPVYLTGSHTWNNLVDMGRRTRPRRSTSTPTSTSSGATATTSSGSWAWDSATWDTRANGALGKDFVHHVAPLPWARTGPGEALDGKPKFDLNRFDAAYFERLRARTDAAGRRGIYVSVMLFEGWGLMHANRGRAAPEGWAWRGHPFHPDNNVNGINAGAAAKDPGGTVHRLSDPATNALQAAYIRKVVDTVNDLDNVLYEVINEGGQKEWDWWVVQTIRDHERTKPKQHPVGITGHGAERLASMLASPADWISPGRADGFGDDPPAWEGKKVSLLDTDHIWGVGGNRRGSGRPSCAATTRSSWTPTTTRSSAGARQNSGSPAPEPGPDPPVGGPRGPGRDDAARRPRLDDDSAWPGPAPPTSCTCPTAARSKSISPARPGHSPWSGSIPSKGRSRRASRWPAAAIGP